VISGNRKILEKLEQMDAKKTEQLLIIHPTINIGSKECMHIRNVIEGQRPTGLIVLPHCCEVILAPKDIEIKIEEGKETND
jgi:hypothetical protein